MSMINIRYALSDALLGGGGCDAMRFAHTAQPYGWGAYCASLYAICAVALRPTAIHPLYTHALHSF